MKGDRSFRPRFGAGVAGLAPYALVAAGVFLAFQIALQPLLQRAPPALAIRLAPTSALVLRRAAEAELSANRLDNAGSLSRDALSRSPFDVRALRVLGLTEARGGHEIEADEILTLAGNWSLRDDPAHAWLVERRLRRGDYASAFAHADTLARRREDIQPQIFRVFSLAATLDSQRSLPVLARLLEASPPWREAYLASLHTTPEGLGVAISLADLLQAGDTPLSNTELQRLYEVLMERGNFDALKAVRAQLGRPSLAMPVSNGGFDNPSAPEPFQWSLTQASGIVAEILEDDIRQGNSALRLEYDGYASAQIARQLTFLAPGSYRFVGESRPETGDAAARLVWTLRCVPAGHAAASIPVASVNHAPGKWEALSTRFEIPPGCPVQWLGLETRPEDKRSTTVAWFDRISISPVD